MQNEKDFYALLQFIDDADEVIFQSIAQHITACGPKILPHLLFLQDTDPKEIVQQRTHALIEQISFDHTINQLVNWANSSYPSLWKGMVLVNEYVLPSTEPISLLTAFNTIRRRVWLELNDYITPLEQIHIINKSLYQLEGFHIYETNHIDLNEFLLENLLIKKKCNSFLMGIFYHLICASLEIPIVLLKIQSKMVLAYAFQDHYFGNIHNENRYVFFVDPISGASFSPIVFEQILNITIGSNELIHAKALTNQEIIQCMLQEIAACFRKPNNVQFKSRLLQIADVLVT
jgi:regulator of sirC expression with transglutaminase-like and TPR domain